MQSDKIVQFLGSLFDKNYTSESKLIKLNSETQNIDNEKRILDLYLKVDNDFFNYFQQEFPHFHHLTIVT